MQEDGDAICEGRGGNVLLSLKDSIGYGDTVNDIPLLETVERAFIVNPGKHSEKLLMTAEKNGWQTILF